MEWMASDVCGLELVVIQIDGIHMDEDMTLVVAIGDACFQLISIERDFPRQRLAEALGGQRS